LHEIFKNPFWLGKFSEDDVVLPVNRNYAERSSLDTWSAIRMTAWNKLSTPPDYYGLVGEPGENLEK